VTRTAAEEIERVANRAAFAAGVQYFAREFGRTLAALLVGVALGLFLAWAAWLLWLAATAGAAILVTPVFCGGAGAAAALAAVAAKRLCR